MKKQKSITINFIMNVVLSMSAFIFPLITFPYVSRVLMPTGTGLVSFANSIIAYFALFAQLGIPTYGIRACAKVRDDKEKLSKVVQELLIINSIISVLVYIVFFASLMIVPKMRNNKTLFIVMSATILFNVIGIEWMYKALEQYTYIAIRSIIFKFIALILMFLLVRSKNDYVWYGVITIFAASASNILNFFNAHKYISLKPIGNYNFKQHLKAITIFFAMSCATTIYTNLDSAMIGFIKGVTENGYYSAAVKIKIVLVSVVTSLGTVLLPRASYYIENGLNDEFKRISNKAINFVFVIAVPMMIYFIIFAPESIFFLAGDAYSKSILPMQIIMPTLLFIGLTNIMGLQMLVPMGKEKYVMSSEIVGAVVDLILNASLIPIFGASGAAIGTVVAEFAVWIVQFLCLRDYIKQIYSNINYGYICCAVFVSMIPAFFIKRLGWNCFLTLVVSAILFFGIYVIILTILKETLVLGIEDKLLRILKLKSNKESKNERKKN
mgnify:FL=1